MLLYISLVGSANIVRWLPSAPASGNADHCLTLDAVTQFDAVLQSNSNWTSVEAHLRKFVGVNNHGSMIRWSLQISGRMKKWLDVLMRFIKPLVKTRALDAGRLEEIWKVLPHAETTDRKWNVLQTAVKIYDVEFVQRRELRAPLGCLYSLTFQLGVYFRGWCLSWDRAGVKVAHGCPGSASTWT